MPITIRQATPQDTQSLEELFLLTRRATFTSRAPEVFQRGDYQKSVEGEEVWVAEQDDIIVGFISLWLPDNFIHNLFVHPDWQQQGVGTMLLKRAEDHLGCPLSLKIAMDNLDACQFYQKHNYELISIHTDTEEPYMLYRKQ